MVERMTEDELREHAIATCVARGVNVGQSEEVIRLFCVRIGIDIEKRGPKVRAYTPSEFTKASNELTRLIKINVDDEIYSVKSVAPNGITYHITHRHGNDGGVDQRTFNNLAKYWIWADTGEPCGVST